MFLRVGGLARELELVADVCVVGGAVGDDGADDGAVVEAEVVGEEFGVVAGVGGGAVAVEVDRDDEGVGEGVVALGGGARVGLVERDGAVGGGRGVFQNESAGVGAFLLAVEGPRGVCV